jgi:hypothetical protein
MMVNLITNRALGLALAVALAVSLAAPCQQQRAAQGRPAGGEELRQYSWKSRTEVRKGGETKSVQLSLVRYGADGALQETPVGGTPPRQIPTSGLRGLIARKKKEQFVEMLGGLRALAKSYGEIPPDKMKGFMAGASVTPEPNSEPALLRLQGKDVLLPGDSMAVWVEAATRKRRRVEIQTTFEGRPVRIVSEFRDLPGGPTYAAQSVLEYPSRELVVITENFEHARVQ